MGRYGQTRADPGSCQLPIPAHKMRPTHIEDMGICGHIMGTYGLVWVLCAVGWFESYIFLSIICAHSPLRYSEIYIYFNKPSNLHTQIDYRRPFRVAPLLSGLVRTPTASNHPASHTNGNLEYLIREVAMATVNARSGVRRGH
ncbi:hypothetical protein BV25DRAFT_716002 [Artomyces pyxidatus]|uniref:Uncharacterized protein n=1 Tax=Artomyces pyxidatus TaxID=48021 RepID=A0ACB8T1B5_9AGAM|nr:hypothetical protein BV25DRAFT_716002 [Artomyces pyxidatus]